jgi:DNA-binding transcriptional MerR regulator
MPIEELSRRSGVTVRNLRELQTRGLLEPPELEGRKGRYTKRHLARVTLVRNLQERGYSIAAIADLLEKWKGSIGPLGIMNFEDGVAAEGVSADRRLDQAEVFALIPELRSDAKLLAQAISVELVCTGADGLLYAPSAELLETARALADTGLPLSVQLADLRVLRKEVELMVRRFRSRFQEHVIAKLERQGMPASAMEELGTRLAHLRPAVVRGVAIVLSAAMERGGPIERAVSVNPAQPAKRKPKAPRASGRAKSRAT